MERRSDNLPKTRAKTCYPNVQTSDTTATGEAAKKSATAEDTAKKSATAEDTAKKSATAEDTADERGTGAKDIITNGKKAILG